MLTSCLIAASELSDALALAVLVDRHRCVELLLEHGGQIARTLQGDWDHDSEEAFVWVDVILRAGGIPADLMEDLLIDSLNTIDPAHG